MEPKNKVLLAGKGWGAISALKSLAEHPHLDNYVLSDDSALLSIVPESNWALSFEGDYDIIICAGWLKQIPLEIIKDNNIINIHYSLLPKYRGLHSVVWALLNDEPEFGFSIHKMNEYFDDGAILYQYRVANDFQSTSVWYMEHFNQQVERILADVVLKYIKGLIEPIEQNKSEASWVGKRTHNDCRIDFQKGIQYQRAFFRALVEPYPLPYFKYKCKIYEVQSCAFHPSEVITHCGRVLNVDNEGLWVSCNGGYLVFENLIDFDSKCSTDINKFKIGVFLDD